MNTHYCLRRARTLHGGSTAIDHADQTLTWREFAGVVEQSARRLAGFGICKGDRVAVLMGNSPAYLDLHFSLPSLGALIVPINTRWHAGEIISTLRDSGARCLIVDNRNAAMADQIRGDMPALFHGTGDCPSGLTDFRALLPDAAASFPEPREDDLVGLFYTSGTTGGPKGTMLSHRNLYSNALHALLPPPIFEPGTRFLHCAPMFHLAGIGAILPLTLTGASHSFLESFDPERVMKLTERYRITTTILVPTMLNMVLNHPTFGQYGLDSLKTIVYGATPMPLPLLKLALEKLPCELIQAYGMTETCGLATILPRADHRAIGGGGILKSAGKPVLGVEIRVVDHEDREVPRDEIGEIVVRGPNVMRGYWNRPEIDAEVLRGGWMHTGDLGRFDEQGYLYVLDRQKDMIKPGGENVYSPEVESVICGHPAILEAAVIGIPDPKWVEAIRAVVTTRPGHSLTESELIEWCRQRLTRFKCPSSVVFLPGTDTLPKSGSGKIQKNVLRERFGR